MPFVEHAGKQVVPLWVNGEARPLQPERYIEVIHAAEGRLAHYAQGADEADALAAVEAAVAAFPAWSQTSHAERRRILLRAADLIESRIEQIAQMQVLETSCMIELGRFLVFRGAETTREIAAATTVALTGAMPPVEGDSLYLSVRHPVGPVLIIPPWNSPAILGPRGMFSALAAGCTVVLKASEMCPAVYRLIVQVFEDAGLPRGAVNMVMARREDAAAVTEAIIAHPAIRKVEFIGSAPIGRQIGITAAKHMKPILMELGGKCPFIVLKDANLKKAVQFAAFGAFLHHGQVCFSTERIIVVKEVAEEFIGLLKEEVSTRYGNGFGSAASKNFADRAHALLEEARQNGAQYIVGDNAFLGAQKTGLRPTIVTGVLRGDRLRDTESFGPSATLYIVADEDEAVALANDSTYGLVAAIWSEDVLRAYKIARHRLEFGAVHVNSCTPNDQPAVPLGAVKGSGWGTQNCAHGIAEFLTHKLVTVHSSSEPFPWAPGS
ncbi:hypothetical protein SLS62_011315 [Diatrype stigma]|uniref:Aldehyde dehydrogenase domain-containing protein n=1 Tax=Diatrype stigma TaxID=117547 RepID=A0AAN9UCM8_9PEZI